MTAFFIDKRNFLVALALVAAVLMPLSVFAQPANTFGNSDPANTFNNSTPANTFGNSSDTDCVTSGSGKLCNPLGNIKGFCGFIKMLFVTIGTIAVPIAVLFLVYAGFKFVWARGNPTGLEEAKKNIFYTILGIAIFFAAWLLALAIGNTLASFGVSVIGNC